LKVINMATLTLTEARSIAKRTGKSFEQVFFEKTGREVRRPEFRMRPAPVAQSRSLPTAAQRRIDRQNQLCLEYMADQIRLAEIREADPKTLRVKLVNGKYHRDYLAEQWDADRRAQEEREHPKSTRLSCESDTWLR
jgi:hypothetical protein